MEQLKDIKPIVAVPDNSLIYLMIITVIFLLILSMIARIIWQRINNKQQNNNRKIALNALNNLDFNNSKAVAYAFEQYGNVLLSEHNLVQFEQINAALMQYKYKKQVGDLDAILIAQIKAFIDA